MKFFIGLLIGVILAIVVSLLFRNYFIELYSGVTLTNRIDSNVQIKEKSFIIQNDKIVGELYEGIIIRHVSNDELKRFSINFALDKYNTLKITKTNESPFSEIKGSIKFLPSYP